MKFLGILLTLSVMAGSAQAQSGFGSDEVTSGADVSNSDVFDLTGLSPEDQTPTGKFTTAAEVGMILDATKGNWSAVREFDGQDLVYFTHIFSWRCGLKAAKFAINDGPLQDLEMPDCHLKYQQPNAILEDEALMTFKRYELGSVQTIRIELLLDNLTVASNSLKRENILIP